MRGWEPMINAPVPFIFLDDTEWKYSEAEVVG